MEAVRRYKGRELGGQPVVAVQAAAATAAAEADGELGQRALGRRVLAASTGEKESRGKDLVLNSSWQAGQRGRGRSCGSRLRAVCLPGLAVNPTCLLQCW